MGVALTAAELRWQALARSVPIATGVVLLLAGCLQFTAWKVRQLRHCRDASAGGQSLSPDARSAYWHGLRLGLHCSLCCSGYMTLLPVTGVMNSGTIAVVATAITAERLAPRPERATRVAGVIVIAGGALMIARALGVA